MKVKSLHQAQRTVNVHLYAARQHLCITDITARPFRHFYGASEMQITFTTSENVFISVHKFTSVKLHVRILDSFPYFRCYNSSDGVALII